VDVGAQVPHAALRFYVRGARGADHGEAPSAAEIAEMGRLVRDAVRAGALGFSTSRTKNHRTSDGRFTPSLTAGAEELLGISRCFGEAGQGVFEVVSDFAGREQEWELFREMVRASGRPMSISIGQSDASPEAWRGLLAAIADANRAGLPIKAQVAARAIGLLLGLEATLHPFSSHPSYREVAALPLAERVARLRDPQLRARLLAEQPAPALAMLVWQFERLFELGDPPDYEPAPEKSIAAEAARLGVAPAERALDLLLERDGRALLYRPFLNYSHFDLGAVREMLLDEHTVPGLGDAGAHCGMICDGSFPTYLLAHWGKARSRGERIPLARLVKAQTADTAALVGLHDRGRIAPGQKADLNVIDFERLGVRPPEIVYDLPAGGKRLLQRATGYDATVLSGVITFERGESTGELPGRLVRGPQQAG
jgi:N-acyl-D-aspartate/D-glutamate deacylase